MKNFIMKKFMIYILVLSMVFATNSFYVLAESLDTENGENIVAEQIEQTTVNDEDNNVKDDALDVVTEDENEKAGDASVDNEKIEDYEKNLQNDAEAEAEDNNEDEEGSEDADDGISPVDFVDEDNDNFEYEEEPEEDYIENENENINADVDNDKEKIINNDIDTANENVNEDTNNDDNSDNENSNNTNDVNNTVINDEEDNNANNENKVENNGIENINIDSIDADLENANLNATPDNKEQIGLNTENNVEEKQAENPPVAIDSEMDVNLEDEEMEEMGGGTFGVANGMMLQYIKTDGSVGWHLVSSDENDRVDKTQADWDGWVDTALSQGHNLIGFCYDSDDSVDIRSYSLQYSIDNMTSNMNTQQTKAAYTNLFMNSTESTLMIYIYAVYAPAGPSYTVTYDQNLPAGATLGNGLTWYADETSRDLTTSPISVSGAVDSMYYVNNHYKYYLTGWINGSTGYSFNSSISDADLFTGTGDDKSLTLSAVWSTAGVEDYYLQLVVTDPNDATFTNKKYYRDQETQFNADKASGVFNITPNLAGKTFAGWLFSPGDPTDPTNLYQPSYLIFPISWDCNMSYTAKFNEADISSIDINTEPTTLQYTVGQVINPSGLSLTIHYVGTTATDTVTYISDTATPGFSFNPSQFDAVGTTTVTVTYKTKTDTFDVTVVEPPAPAPAPTGRAGNSSGASGNSDGHQSILGPMGNVKMLNDRNLITKTLTYNKDSNTYRGTDSEGNEFYGHWFNVPGTRTWLFGVGEDTQGLIYSGWYELDWQGQKKWYHFDNNGEMQRGFIEDNGKIYYLSEDMNDSWNGGMVMGHKYINGILYNFDAKGALIQQIEQ